jgi:hypothetical protein
VCSGLRELRTVVDMCIKFGGDQANHGNPTVVLAVQLVGNRLAGLRAVSGYISRAASPRLVGRGETSMTVSGRWRQTSV